MLLNFSLSTTAFFYKVKQIRTDLETLFIYRTYFLKLFYERSLLI